MWTRLWNRCRFLFRRRQFDLELREEMDFHREMLAADKTRAGLMPDEALLAARRQLGNALVAQEEARLPWTAVSIRVSRGLAIDLREAMRGLRAGRGTTVLAVLILTLGIAAGTVTFSVVDALALRQLPYHDPPRLTAVARVSGRDAGYASLAPQDYFALARGVSAFDGVAAAGYTSLPGETADSPPVIGARAYNSQLL
jgi:macrolide transport system ATP-binding/permease protein